MSKRKKKEKRHIPEFWEGLAEVGIESVDDFWELVSGEKEEPLNVIEQIENGYYDIDDAIKEDDYTSSPEELCLAKYKGRYIVYPIPGMTNGWGLEMSNIDAGTFDAEDAAREYFESCRGVNYKGFKEMLRECKSQMKDNVYIKEGGGLDVQFRVYYNRDLIIEHARDLDPVRFQQQVDRYKELEETLRKEYGTHISGIRKDRAWNDNQRYYVFDLYSSDCGSVEMRIHIKSVFQGRDRDVLDFFSFAEMEKLGIRKDPERFAREEEERREAHAEYEREKAKRESEALFLHKDEFKALRKYLEKGVFGRCDGTLAMTEKWLEKNIPADRKKDIPDILDELRFAGGFCDCEVVMNAGDFYRNHK